MNEADESFVFSLDRGLAVVPIACHVDASRSGSSVCPFVRC